jgi:ubiquitin-like-conjugating enzyme ATG3
MFTKRFLYENMKLISNSITGPMTTSSFQKTGKLTPEEFVKAGDTLIQKFPSWEWQGKSIIQPYLPPDKKYLMLKFCYSKERVGTQYNIINDKVSDAEWTITEIQENTNNNKKIICNNIIVGESDGDSDSDNDVINPNLRRYDLTIVYDEFYCTPRLFLFGYSYDNTPLTRDEMMDDVYAENREKTVTIDPHPYLMFPSISIHPCRHAEVLQRMIQRIADNYNNSNGEENSFDMAEDETKMGNDTPFVFPPHLALFLFLKFMNTVIPTISYDM